MFMWGSSSDDKMGILTKQTTVDQPIYAEWRVEKTGFYTETGKPAVRNQLHYIDPIKEPAGKVGKLPILN